MPGVRDYTGVRQGRLVGVRRLDERDHRGQILWEIRCDCGRTIKRPGHWLTHKMMTTCTTKGRAGEEPYKCPLGRTHGATVNGQPTKEFRAWARMLSRVKREDEQVRKYYKDKGIGVCCRWKDFALFLADLGPMPEGKNSVDRHDNDVGYCCGNPECSDCGPLKRKRNGKWADPKEQGNNRSTNVWVTYKGRRRTLKQWSEETGIKYPTLCNRYRNGWRGRKLFSTVRTNRRRDKFGRYK